MLIVWDFETPGLSEDAIKGFKLTEQAFMKTGIRLEEPRDPMSERSEDMFRVSVTNIGSVDEETEYYEDLCIKRKNKC